MLFTLVCVDLPFWVFGFHYAASLGKKWRAFPQHNYSSANETEHERYLSRLQDPCGTGNEQEYFINYLNLSVIP